MGGICLRRKHPVVPRSRSHDPESGQTGFLIGADVLIPLGVCLLWRQRRVVSAFKGTTDFGRRLHAIERGSHHGFYDRAALTGAYRTSTASCIRIRFGVVPAGVVRCKSRAAELGPYLTATALERAVLAKSIAVWMIQLMSEFPTGSCSRFDNHRAGARGREAVLVRHDVLNSVGCGGAGVDLTGVIGEPFTKVWMPRLRSCSGPVMVAPRSL